MAGPALGTWEQLPLTPLSLHSGPTDTGPQALQNVNHIPGKGSHRLGRDRALVGRLRNLPSR